jgi:quinol monooxygenase YgiN
MMLVTGSVTAREDSIDEALELSLDHVRRSRKEPGCISHAVHTDCENQLRLVFIENWVDACGAWSAPGRWASADWACATQPCSLWCWWLLV